MVSKANDRGPTWEFREFTVQRNASREDIRVALTVTAETEHWELARTRIFRDGRREYRLRRRVYRVIKSA